MRTVDLEEKYQNQASILIRYAQEQFLFQQNSIIDNYISETTKNITKAQKRYKKHCEKYPDEKGIDCSDYLRKFCIPLQYIPKDMISLMQGIEWINPYSGKPYNKQGFYSDTFKHDFNTMTEWYITIEQYIALLWINANLKDKYASEVVA